MPNSIPIEFRGELINYLSQFITEKRLSVLHQTLNLRTRYITVVLEDVYQPQNASAVLRTCECFGIQDVHVIERKNKFTANPQIVMGSAKWLTITKYPSGKNSTLDAFNTLRQKGYRIVATSPHANDCSISNFDLSKGKAALIFGTELRGLSNEAMNSADEFIYIPTVGFTESLNLSVSAAVCVHTLTQRLKNEGVNHSLSEDEKEEIILQWLRLSIKSSQSIIKRFFQSKNQIIK